MTPQPGDERRQARRALSYAIGFTIRFTIECDDEPTEENLKRVLGDRPPRPEEYPAIGEYVVRYRNGEVTDEPPPPPRTWAEEMTDDPWWYARQVKAFEGWTATSSCGRPVTGPGTPGCGSSARSRPARLLTGCSGTTPSPCSGRGTSTWAREAGRRSARSTWASRWASARCAPCGTPRTPTAATSSATSARPTRTRPAWRDPADP